jgi:hypothetical protein
MRRPVRPRGRASGWPWPNAGSWARPAGIFFNIVQYCTAIPPAVRYLPDVSAEPRRRMLSLYVGRIVGGIIIEALAGKTAGCNVDDAVMTAEVKTK